MVIEKKVLFSGVLTSCLLLLGCGDDSNSTNNNVKPDDTDTPSVTPTPKPETPTPKPDTSNPTPEIPDNDSQPYEFTSFIVNYSDNGDDINYVNRQMLQINKDGVMLNEYDIYATEDYVDEDMDSIEPELILAKNLTYLVKDDFKNINLIGKNSFEQVYEDKMTGEKISTILTKNPVKLSSSYSENITTTLDHLPRITKNTVNFPTGSLCYTYSSKLTKNHFSFELDFPSSFLTLQDWKDSKTSYNDPQPVFKTSLVGSKNNISAVTVTYPSEDDADVSITNQANVAPIEEEAAVLYNGKVYEGTFFYPFDISSATDPSIDEIYCLGYNKTAADYIESQISKYYN